MRNSAFPSLLFVEKSSYNKDLPYRITDQPKFCWRHLKSDAPNMHTHKMDQTLLRDTIL